MRETWLRVAAGAATRAIADHHAGLAAIAHAGKALVAEVLEGLIDLVVAVVVAAVADLLGEGTTQAAGVELEVLVDLVVAVIVLTVADFFGIRDPAFAALVEQPFVDFAVAVVVDLVALLHAPVGGFADAAFEAVVDFAVAVVVEAVTDFGRCRALLHAAVDFVVCHADHDPAALALAHTDDADVAESAEGFVDLAVAVVIEVVAELCGWLAAHLACVEDAFVDVAVAVVVAVVALLGGGHDRISLKFAALVPVGGAGQYAFAEADPIATIVTGCAGVVAVVDDTVTVVVLEVAEFERGKHGVVAGAPAQSAVDADAELDPGSASPHTLGPFRARVAWLVFAFFAALTTTRDTFVALAVAVVVPAVADLRRRRGLVSTREFVAVAVGAADATQAHASGAIGPAVARLAIEAIVGDSVAVVVEPVADFFGGLHVPAALQPLAIRAADLQAHDALADAGEVLVGASEARALQSGPTVMPFVGHAVAVIVDAVAVFGETLAVLAAVVVARRRGVVPASVIVAGPVLDGAVCALAVDHALFGHAFDAETGVAEPIVVATPHDPPIVLAAGLAQTGEVLVLGLVIFGALVVPVEVAGDAFLQGAHVRVEAAVGAVNTLVVDHGVFDGHGAAAVRESSFDTVQLGFLAPWRAGAWPVPLVGVALVHDAGITPSPQTDAHTLGGVATVPEGVLGFLRDLDELAVVARSAVLVVATVIEGAGTKVFGTREQTARKQDDVEITHDTKPPRGSSRTLGPTGCCGTRRNRGFLHFRIRRRSRPQPIPSSRCRHTACDLRSSGTPGTRSTCWCWGRRSASLGGWLKTPNHLRRSMS